MTRQAKDIPLRAHMNWRNLRDSADIRQETPIHGMQASPTEPLQPSWPTKLDIPGHQEEDVPRIETLQKGKNKPKYGNQIR